MGRLCYVKALVSKMASSPVRPGTPEGGQEPTPENCIPPDSIKAVAEGIGVVPMHEEAIREMVRKTAFDSLWQCLTAFDDF